MSAEARSTVSSTNAIGTLVSIFCEARHAFREAIPWRWLRIGFVIFAIIFELSLVTLLALHPPRPHQPLTPNILVGFLGFNLLLTIATAGAALARVLAHPERLTIFQLAPIGENAAIAHLLAPAIFAALCPISLIGLPFAVLAALGAPRLGLALFIASVTAFVWAILATIAVGSWLGKRFGRVRGSQILRSFSYFIGFGTLLSFRGFVHLGEGAMPLLALAVATPFALRPLAVRASRALVATLLGTESTPHAQEPTWGAPDLWRMLGRSLSLPAVIAAVPSLAYLLSKPALRPLAASFLVVQLVVAPLDRLLEPELQNPDRLRLAPEGNAFRWRLIAQCGGLACAVALAVGAAVASGSRRWVWFAAVGTVSLLAPLTCLLGSKRVLFAFQLVLLGAALGATALWSA